MRKVHLPLLRELRDRLQEFVEEDWSVWQLLAEDYDLLRRALREAVEHSERMDPLPLLEECWGWLRDERALGQVSAYCLAAHERVDLDAERLHGNACALVATALGAATAKRARSHDDDAVARSQHWRQEAATLLGSAFAVDELEVAFHRGDPGLDEPNVVIPHASDAVNWAAEKPTEPQTRSKPRELCIPVAGYDAGRGFLADLRLELLAEGGPLVEHPDMALRPLGKGLLKAMEQAWQTTRQCVRWTLTLRDDDVSASLPLDGASLSGAATVGFKCLHEERPYDPGRIILARVDEKGFLWKVGCEKQKLEAARRWGIKRAMVGADTDLTETDIEDFRRRGLEVE